MRNLSPKVLRELLSVVGTHPNLRDTERARLLVAIHAAITPKRSAKPAAKRRAVKKATRKQKTADVRAAVMERAGSFCEVCGAYPTDREPDLDHFRSGAHKRSNESIEGCWALCRPCHHAKTDNVPDRIYWLRTFREHCLKYSYTREARETERLIDALHLSGRAVSP